MDRKILASMLAIGLVSVLASAATFTWLSDKEEISWTITVKTADIEAPTSVTFTDELAPGESTSETITVTNNGEVKLKVTLSTKPEEPKWVTFTFTPNDFELTTTEAKEIVVKVTLSEEFKDSGAELTGKIIVDAVQS